ncbi:MAG: hypothetical protein WC915_01905 [archaeon]|jgi:ribosomal protein S18 acetylase RimI-like enzyme
MKNEFPTNDLQIIKLSKTYFNLLKEFDCGIKDLNDFLVDDSFNQMSENVNITYIWISKKQKRIVGYITICNDSIHLSGNKKEEMKKIGISYKALPALKICRMAVGIDFANQGVGSKMILFTIDLINKINRFSACRFLTLEAKNDTFLPKSKKPIHFYKKLDFKITKERWEKSSYIPMYRDLHHLIQIN